MHVYHLENTQKGMSPQSPGNKPGPHSCRTSALSIKLLLQAQHPAGNWEVWFRFPVTTESNILCMFQCITLNNIFVCRKLISKEALLYILTLSRNNFLCFLLSDSNSGETQKVCPVRRSPSNSFRFLMLFFFCIEIKRGNVF